MKRFCVAVRALLVAVLTIGTLAMVGASPARAANPTSLNVTIHDVWQVNCDDNDIADIGDTCGNDYYAKVFIGGVELPRSPRAADNLSEVHPNWRLSGVVDLDAGPVPIRIQLWDHDSTSGDDLVDIAPGDSNLDITFDPLTGDYTGDIQSQNVGYAKGSGKDAAAIFFTITLGDNDDLDGDGLHDGIERSAIVDRDGNVPAHGNLYDLGSNPCRPTVLVEIDYMVGAGHTHQPTAAAINEARAAFDAGDVPARLDCPYPSSPKTGGVQLLMVVDQALPETDKISWDSPSGAGAVNGKTIRDDNFDKRLRPYFHYSLWIHNQPDAAPSPGAPLATNSSSGLCCAEGKDVLVSLGQWAGSVGTTRDQSGTFLHELGHALGLGHGGGDDVNCKPNYHSAMSYVYQSTGIPDASLPAPTVDLNGDGTVDGRDRLRLDYSRVALRDLDEDALDEGAGIGAGSDTFLWDGDGSRPWRSSAGNVAVDWDRDNPRSIDADDVPTDVNFMGIPGSQGCPTATPPTGAPGPELKGYDDWANLKYKGPLSPRSTGVSFSPHQEIDVTTAAFIRAAVREALSATDMIVQLADAPDPVGAGTSLTYTVTAENHGTANTAYSSVTVLTLPTDVAFISASAGCSHAAGTVTCALGDVAVGGHATATVTASVPADLVATNGGPKTITASARVSHDGPDDDQSDNTAEATTRVIAMADLETVSAAAVGVPSEMIIGTPAQFTLRRVIDNNGPSAPVDATITTTGSASAGASVDPVSGRTETAMAKDAPRTVEETVTVNCAAPGAHTFTVVAGIRPASADDVDPNLANNEKSVSVSIQCVVPVAINIRPHHEDNRFSLSTADVNVGLLTTRAGEYGLPLAFDATAADITSVRFGPRETTFAGGGASDRRGKLDAADSWERSNEALRDGDVDLEFRFVRAETGIPSGTSEACLKGTAKGPAGTFKFFGCDTIVIHP